jgi:hypothetical protein
MTWKYLALFNGRRVGAIGTTSRFAVEVEGASPEECQLKLYDRYEHISSLRIAGCNCGGFLDHYGAYVHADGCERPARP